LTYYIGSLVYRNYIKGEEKILPLQLVKKYKGKTLEELLNTKEVNLLRAKLLLFKKETKYKQFYNNLRKVLKWTKN